MMVNMNLYWDIERRMCVIKLPSFNVDPLQKFTDISTITLYYIIHFSADWFAHLCFNGHRVYNRVVTGLYVRCYVDLFIHVIRHLCKACGIL